MPLQKQQPTTSSSQKSRLANKSESLRLVTRALLGYEVKHDRNEISKRTENNPRTAACHRRKLCRTKRYSGQERAAFEKGYLDRVSD